MSSLKLDFSSYSINTYYINLNQLQSTLMTIKTLENKVLFAKEFTSQFQEDYFVEEGNVYQNIQHLLLLNRF